MANPSTTLSAPDGSLTPAGRLRAVPVTDIPPALSQGFRTRQILVALAAIGLFGPALVAWSSIVQLPLVGLIATLCCLACIAIVLMAVSAKTERALDHLDVVVLVLAVVALVAWAITELYFYPAYGTDESAFVQYAANLQLHGHDPYGANLLPALTQFHVPIQYATYQLNGSIASTLSYPALSFLLVIPGLWITGGTQAIIAENALFLIFELVLVFAFLPKPFRALGAVLVLGVPFLFDYTLGGDIITFSIPFMLLVAYRWSDIGRAGTLGSSGALRAVSLGLAASITQFPWFVVPFLLLGIWRLRSAEVGNRRAVSVTLRFAALAGGAFVVVNLPWIVLNTKTWLQGILTPITQHAIPFGQGLIDLTAFFRIGGGNLEGYTYASLFSFVALLVAYAVCFRRLARMLFVLPSVVFIFSTRSLSEYFIMAVALWLVSLASPGDSTRSVELVARPHPARHAKKPSGVGRSLRVAVVVAPVLATGGFLVSALVTPAPISIRIESVQTNGQFRAIWQIKAAVTNSSDNTITPHFATDASGYMTTFWNLVSGPRTLAPRSHGVYTLVAPNVGSMPGVTQPFVLQAVTSSPPTMSSSGLFTPESFDSLSMATKKSALMAMSGPH